MKRVYRNPIRLLTRQLREPAQLKEGSKAFAFDPSLEVPCVRTLDRLSTANQSDEEQDCGDDDKRPEQDLRNANRRASDSAESEHSSNQGDDQED